MCWQYSTGSSGWAHWMSLGSNQSHVPMPPNFLILSPSSGSVSFAAVASVNKIELSSVSFVAGLSSVVVSGTDTGSFVAGMSSSVVVLGTDTGVFVDVGSVTSSMEEKNTCKYNVSVFNITSVAVVTHLLLQLNH